MRNLIKLLISLYPDIRYRSGGRYNEQRSDAGPQTYAIPGKVKRLEKARGCVCGGRTVHLQTGGWMVQDTELLISSVVKTEKVFENNVL